MSFPASPGMNLPTSGQLQEAAIALATTAGKYTAVSEELVAVATTALAAGQDLTTHWQGKAPASFLTSLDKLAGDVSNIADALATSANAMMTLSQAIGSNAGTIGTANQLTAQQPTHPSSGQAQQLGNALTAASTAIGAITAAANTAAGQLDQVKGVGTCSTGKGRIAAVTFAAGLLTGALIGKALSKGKGGGGKQPPGQPPAPPAGDEPPGKRWHHPNGKPYWQLRLFRAFKDGVFALGANVWYNDAKNYAMAYGQPKWEIPIDMIIHPSYNIKNNIQQNSTGTIISVVFGGLAGGFGEDLLPWSVGIPGTKIQFGLGEQLAKHGGAAGTFGGNLINGAIRPLPHPIQLIAKLPNNRVEVRVFQNGQYQVVVWDYGKFISELQKSGQPLTSVPPGVLSPSPTPSGSPTPTPIVPHPPLG